MTTQAQSRLEIFELPLPAPATSGSKACVADLQPSGQKSFARKLLAEPLFHFLLAGALILAGSSLLRCLDDYLQELKQRELKDKEKKHGRRHRSD